MPLRHSLYPQPGSSTSSEPQRICDDNTAARRRADFSDGRGTGIRNSRHACDPVEDCRDRGGGRLRKRQNEQAVPDSQERGIDRFRAQHMDLAQREIVTEAGCTGVTVDENESPLAWLARRRGRDGRMMIEWHQLQAGERLRAEFTRAHLMPRTTSNWSNPVPSDRRSGGNRTNFLADTVIAARQRVHHALDAVGPEFAGLLVDVCCFLKRLEIVERERGWPVRSAKIVLQLALERLARHFGYAASTSGCARSQVRTWFSDSVDLGVD